MTLYKFPSGKIASDETYKDDFQREYPSDRPEAQPDYVAPSKNDNVQVNLFDDESEEEED